MYSSPVDCEYYHGFYPLSTSFCGGIMFVMEKITDEIVLAVPTVKVGGDAVKVEDESNDS
jgi:hypothetical protein|tara:strand:- start:967 stop:1146 length:180 start_codon:yes stop_codon:yes gene_type:complete